MTQISYTPNWAFAWGGQLGSCLFKETPGDFIVDELLPFEPSGEGEHALLSIEKCGENTDWVAGQLAKFARVKRSAVSYAGRKDRQGITRQWFSVWMPGKEMPDWSGFSTETIKVIEATKHGKKLRTGALKGNRFTITLKAVNGDHTLIDQRLNLISSRGVPNYFGGQRFGRGGHNIDQALKMFAGELLARKNRRSMYLSASRSWLFNQVISERIKQDNWCEYIAGDVPGFQDSGSLILRDHDEALMARIETGSVVLTAPLWGAGELLSSEDCRMLEELIAKQNEQICSGLEAEGLKQERRGIRLIPEQMQWQWLSEDSLQLTFALPKGCFATAVLREVLDCREEDNDEDTVK